MTLSMIVPAYNEAAGVCSAIEANADAAQKIGVQYEIVAIDDGSTDETLSKLRELEGKLGVLRVIAHKKNQGFGAALRTGILAARYEFCIAFPVDSPCTAEKLKPFMEAAEDSDLVLGYREKRLGYSPLMLLNTKIFHGLVRVLCKINYRDMNWTHLYRRSIFEKINIESQGIVMGAEVILKAHLLNLRIREVPCSMDQRTTGTASASRPIVMFRTGLDLLWLLRRWFQGTLLDFDKGGLLGNAKGRGDIPSEAS